MCRTGITSSNLVTLTLFVVVLLTAAVLWGRQSYWCGQIDVSSGRYRSVTRLLGVKVRDAIEETALSRMYEELIGEPGAPQWRTVVGVMGLLASLRHHNDFYADTDTVAGFLRRGSFTREAKRRAILDMLYMLGNYGRKTTGTYVEELGNLVDEKAGALIDVSDLPRVESVIADVNRDITW